MRRLAGSARREPRPESGLRGEGAAAPLRRNALGALLAAAVLASCGGGDEPAPKAPEFYWGWWQLVQVGSYLLLDEAPAEYRTPSYLLVGAEGVVPIRSVSEFVARAPEAGAPTWAFTAADGSGLDTAVLSLRRRAGAEDALDLVVGERSITAVRAASPRDEGSFVATAASLLPAGRAGSRALMQAGVSLVIQNALNEADRLELLTGSGGVIEAESAVTGDPYVVSFPGLDGAGTVVLRPAYAGASAGFAAATASGSPNYKLYRPSYAADLYLSGPVAVDMLAVENVGADSRPGTTYTVEAGAGAQLYDAEGNAVSTLTGPVDLAAGGRRALALKLYPTGVDAVADGARGYTDRSLRLTVADGSGGLWEDELVVRFNLEAVRIYVTYDAASSGGGTNYPIYAVIRPDNRVSQALAANIPGGSPLLAPDPRDAPDRPEPCLVLVRNEHQATRCAVGTGSAYWSGLAIPSDAPTLAGNSATSPTEVAYGQALAFTIPKGAEYWFSVATR